LNPQTAADGEEEAGEPPQIGYIPDMMEELQLLERAGLGFGEKETFKIYSAIKKLCQAKGASSMTFWGKVFGLKKDYYVVQAALEGGEEGEQPPNVEPKGTGINEKIYFVTNNSISYFPLTQKSWTRMRGSSSQRSPLTT
jgi:radial spoke head protein 4A